MATLHDAAKGHLPLCTVRNMISRGSLELRDQNQQTALHIATKYGQYEIMKLLLEANPKADIEAKDKYEETPLHVTACYDLVENVVQCLVNNGANLDATDIYGRTPLIWAARKGYRRTIEILINAGAKIDVKDNDGKTAKDQAATNVQDLFRSSGPSQLPSRPRGSVPVPKDIYAFIEGRHIKPTKLSDEFINRELRQECFGEYLAITAEAGRPLTLKTLLQTLTPRTWLAYAVDEGIGLTFQSPRKNSRVRIVAICTPNNQHPSSSGSDHDKANGEQLAAMAFKVPTLAILAVPPFNRPDEINSDRSILQVASFNPNNGWFNFYDRARGEGGESRWCYFGSSKDAYTPDTQGLGPFCGHANGTIVMREPEEPWLHWHSSISELVVPNSHPLFNDPLHRDQQTGKWYFGEPKQLSTMIARGTEAWFSRRRIIDMGPPGQPKSIAERVHQWIAHVCLTTSITVSSAKEPSGGNFRIPSGFFFNARALDLVIPGMLDLETKIDQVLWKNYNTARELLGLVTVFKFSATADEPDEVAMDSEGRMMWKVVTPSLEDIDGIDRILKAGLLPDTVLAAMLMVDFWNPVFSYRRAQLMRYIPSTATLSEHEHSEADRYDLGADLLEVIVNAIKNLDLPGTSPEVEFLRLMKKPDLTKFAREEITDYVNKINQQLQSPEGVFSYMRLAETKRRLFRPPPRTQKPQHPLGEFDMMLPYASRMPQEETWIMKRDATVENIVPPTKIWHPRNSQIHFSSAGCPFSASF